MESNFNFLEGHEFHDELLRAEEYLSTDHGSCAGKIRLVLENAVKHYYSDVSHLNIRKVPIEHSKHRHPSLKDLIDCEGFTDMIDDNNIIASLHEMRGIGNDGVHKLNYKKNKLVEYLRGIHSFLKRYSFDILGKEVFDEFDHELTSVSSNSKNTEIEIEAIQVPSAQKERKFENELKEVFDKQVINDDKLREKLKTEDKTIVFFSAGITELMGKIWGRVFVNFSYLGDEYYAVKYFQNEGGAKEKFKIGKGKYESIGLYTMFEKKHSELSKEEVLKGTYDKKLNLAGDFPARYGTPSLLLSKLITEIGEYFRLQEMTVKVEFKGHYYKKEDSKFRNILEVSVEDTPKDSPFELIVIMINPGGSKPLSNDSSNWGDSPSLYHGVSCKPDDTQHQIVKLMELKNWKKAVVLNLFDKCNVNSPEIIEHYTGSKNKREHLKESVFHEDRRTELESIFKLAADNAPILIGWGVSEKLSKIKASIFNNVLVPTGRQIVGWKTKDFQFYHPWPRKRDDIRDEWPSVIFEQLKNS
jgi:hypothetical protein